MRVLYLDESGNHDLKTINPNYPVFVLGGVIVDRSYARSVITPELDAFKLRYLGHNGAVLHTTDMHRLRQGFGILADPMVRRAFYDELNALIASWDFQVIACAIRLEKHLRHYLEDPPDPYMASLDVLVEQFCRSLEGTSDSGFICAEARNPGLDRKLRAAWDAICQNGTGTTTALEIDERIVHLTLKTKTPNVAGMQLADLAVTQIGREVLQLPTKPDEVNRGVIISKVLRFSGSDAAVTGLTVFPVSEGKA